MYVISFPEQRRQVRNKKRAAVCDETKLEVDNTTAVQNAPWNQGDIEVLTRLARDWQIFLAIIQISRTYLLTDDSFSGNVMATPVKRCNYLSKFMTCVSTKCEIDLESIQLCKHKTGRSPVA
jgi:hypothetical protein